MEKEFEGKPNYPGEVEGHLIRDISSISKYENPILYTTDFTIDHTIILDKVKGIIAKRGSWSAHVAIVAREFQIPSVLGVDLDNIPEGSKVRLIVPRDWFSDKGINKARVLIY